jgi:hypothetical protein
MHQHRQGMKFFNACKKIQVGALEKYMMQLSYTSRLQKNILMI